MFVLRAVTITSTGREIVREQRLAHDTLTFGRNPSCDIHVTDLAVAANHATIRRTGPTSVLVEPAPGLSITVDGKAETEQTIDALAGGEFRIGHQRINFSMEGEDIAIVLREAQGRRERRGERQFALSAVGPSKRVMSWSVIALVLALFLAWPIWSFFGPRDARAYEPQAAMSSGPLSAAHVGLSKDCKACHLAPFEPVTDKACATCHTDAHAHADPARLASSKPWPGGFAAVERVVAQTFGRSSGRCVDCHTEHDGAPAMAPTKQAMCVDCHGDMKSRLGDTKLADAGDFATSHPQFTATVAAPERGQTMLRSISLDGKPQADNGLTFAHDLHLKGGGTVARMASTLGRNMSCASCHKPEPNGAGFAPFNMERDCAACHVLDVRHGDVSRALADASAIAAPSVAGVPRRRPGTPGIVPFGGASRQPGAALLFGPDGSCRDCHRVDPGFRIAPVVQQARFMRSGWFDHAPHRDTQCATCHKADSSGAATDLLLPGIATCRTCHAGEEAKAPLVPSGCAMCHDYHRSDAPPRFSRGRREDTTDAAPLRLDWRG